MLRHSRMDRNLSRAGFANPAILIACFVFLATAVSNDVRAQAQTPQYDSLTVAPQYLYPEPTGQENSLEKRELDNLKRDVDKLVRAGKSFCREVVEGKTNRTPAFDSYFNEYIFPNMAQSTDATTSSVGLFRRDFIKSFLSPTAKPGANRTYLIEQLTVPMCRRLATGNYHPSVRMNAVYLAGLLNDREGEPGVAPAPNKLAFSLLLEVLGMQDTPEYLVVSTVSALTRIAEIEGVESHALDTPALRNYAVSVLNGQASGQAKWQPALDYWLRKRSIQILGFLKDTSSIGILNKIALDSAQPMQLRIDSAEALARMNFAGTGSVAGETVMAVAHLSADVLSGESKEIRSAITELVSINNLWSDTYLIDPSFVSPLPAGSGNAPPTGGMGGGAASSGGDQGAGLAGGDDRGGGGGGDGRGTGGARGGGGATPSADPTKLRSWREFDLPNYCINMVRRRSKAYIYTCDSVLQNVQKAKLVGGNELTVMEQTLAVLKTAMSDTDMGLKDLGAKTDRRTAPEMPFGEEEDKTSNTIKMLEMFEKHSAKVREFLPKVEPAAEGQPAAAQGQPNVSVPTGTGT